jgi:hypothetical protein
VLLSANVVAFGFHVAFEQNFGWLYETAKKSWKIQLINKTNLAKTVQYKILDSQWFIHWFRWKI